MHEREKEEGLWSGMKGWRRKKRNGKEELKNEGSEWLELSEGIDGRERGEKGSGIEWSEE